MLLGSPLSFVLFAIIITKCSAQYCPFPQIPCYGSSRVGTECYNPAKQTCNSNGVVCDTSWRLCGTNCYNPFDGKKTCWSNKLLCDFGASLCGDPSKNGKCYDMMKETCWDIQEAAVCPRDQTYDRIKKKCTGGTAWSIGG
jgi:hypothetical protein